jgi:hypothetical protein
MSVFKFAGLTIPFSGGGYFRLLPYPIIRYGINRCLEENRPAMMYLHPWEFDPQQPKLSGRWFDRKKHYLNLSKTEDKFKKLLKEFRFDTVQSVLRAQGFSFKLPAIKVLNAI